MIVELPGPAITLVYIRAGVDRTAGSFPTD